jgi:hypothetical protein
VWKPPPKPPPPVKTCLFKADRAKLQEAIRRRLDCGRGPPIDDVGRGNLWKLLTGAEVELTGEQLVYVRDMIDSVA